MVLEILIIPTTAFTEYTQSYVGMFIFIDKNYFFFIIIIIYILIFVNNLYHFLQF